MKKQHSGSTGDVRRFRGKKGSVLVIVLVTMTLLIVVMSTLWYTVSNQTSQEIEDARVQQVYQSAISVNDWAFDYINGLIDATNFSTLGTSEDELSNNLLRAIVKMSEGDELRTSPDGDLDDPWRPILKDATGAGVGEYYIDIICRHVEEPADSTTQPFRKVYSIITHVRQKGAEQAFERIVTLQYMSPDRRTTPDRSRNAFEMSATNVSPGGQLGPSRDARVDYSSFFNGGSVAGGTEVTVRTNAMTWFNGDIISRGDLKFNQPAYYGASSAIDIVVGGNLSITQAYGLLNKGGRIFVQGDFSLTGAPTAGFGADSPTYNPTTTPATFDSTTGSFTSTPFKPIEIYVFGNFTSTMTIPATAGGQPVRVYTTSGYYNGTSVRCNEIIDAAWVNDFMDDKLTERKLKPWVVTDFMDEEQLLLTGMHSRATDAANNINPTEPDAGATGASTTISWQTSYADTSAASAPDPYDEGSVTPYAKVNYVYDVPEREIEVKFEEATPGGHMEAVIQGNAPAVTYRPFTPAGSIFSGTGPIPLFIMTWWPDEVRLNPQCDPTTMDYQTAFGAYNTYAAANGLPSAQTLIDDTLAAYQADAVAEGKPTMPAVMADMVSTYASTSPMCEVPPEPAVDLPERLASPAVANASASGVITSITTADTTGTKRDYTLIIDTGDNADGLKNDAYIVLPGDPSTGIFKWKQAGIPSDAYMNIVVRGTGSVIFIVPNENTVTGAEYPNTIYQMEQKVYIGHMANFYTGFNAIEASGTTFAQSWQSRSTGVVNTQFGNTMTSTEKTGTGNLFSFTTHPYQPCEITTTGLSDCWYCDVSGGSDHGLIDDPSTPWDDNKFRFYQPDVELVTTLYRIRKNVTELTGNDWADIAAGNLTINYYPNSGTFTGAGYMRRYTNPAATSRALPVGSVPGTYSTEQMEKLRKVDYWGGVTALRHDSSGAVLTNASSSGNVNSSLLGESANAPYFLHHNIYIADFSEPDSSLSPVYIEQYSYLDGFFYSREHTFTSVPNSTLVGAYIAQAVDLTEYFNTNFVRPFDYYRYDPSGNLYADTIPYPPRLTNYGATATPNFKLSTPLDSRGYKQVD
ncbi:hypothetical protein FACS189499_05950 [Clostridia bacterium]|nr:hypothetical protein FACS189499_05950 [Clostridia bacterium]